MELTNDQHKDLLNLSKYLRKIKGISTHAEAAMDSLADEFKNGHYPVYPRKSKKRRSGYKLNLVKSK